MTMVCLWRLSLLWNKIKLIKNPIIAHMFNLPSQKPLLNSDGLCFFICLNDFSIFPFNLDLNKAQIPDKKRRKTKLFDSFQLSEVRKNYPHKFLGQNKTRDGCVAAFEFQLFLDSFDFFTNFKNFCALAERISRNKNFV